MKPKEGTILTVAKGAADKALEYESRGHLRLHPPGALLHLCQPVHRKPDLLCIPAGRVVLAPLSVSASSAMNIFFLLPGQQGAYKYRKV